VSRPIQIEASWKSALSDQFDQPYFESIRAFLRDTIGAGRVVYPPGPLIFNAFNQTPFDAVRVVVLGQDPYHNPGEAMGLSFSVPSGVRIPPSLVNIFKEIQRDLGLPMPTHGDLSGWAKQGVLLLNAILTVEAGKAGAHQQIGWQQFTDVVIQRLSARRDGIVFMLWGRFAQSKRGLIDASRHLLLEAAHPSPLARDAFRGCRHFSQANAWLEERGESGIDWRV
jgi:uracil-DNA glycosylase